MSTPSVRLFVSTGNPGFEFPNADMPRIIRDAVKSLRHSIVNGTCINLESLSIAMSSAELYALLLAQGSERKANG